MKNQTAALHDLAPPSALMTKDEVAHMLKKSRRTIEYWVKAGYLSCIRISHSVLFDRQQVMADLKRFETLGRPSRRG